MAAIVLGLGAAGVSAGPGTIVPGQFDFTTFYIPGTTEIHANAINESGVIAGNLTAGGEIQGFSRLRNGSIVPIIPPTTASPGFSRAVGINAQGTIVGQFYPTGGPYTGFFLRGGNYTPYNVPGRPPGSTTGISGINEKGDFCGWLLDAPNFPVQYGFVNEKGHLTVFSVAGSTSTAPFAINNRGDIAGSYLDSSGVAHGFFRDSNGQVTLIDVPGAAFAGTVLFGLNQPGDMSGHFWDSKNREHGFLLTKHGVFYQIDVPGALATAGGGLNNEGTVVGHFIDGNGIFAGYIAKRHGDD